MVLPHRYHPGCSKAEAINGLQPLSYIPQALIGTPDQERSGPLMAVMDACNARFGWGEAIRAWDGLFGRRTWNSRFETRPPRYTIQIAELPVPHV